MFPNLPPPRFTWDEHPPPPNHVHDPPTIYATCGFHDAYVVMRINMPSLPVPMPMLILMPIPRTPPQCIMQRLILHAMPLESAGTCASRPRCTGKSTHRPSHVPSECTKSNKECVHSLGPHSGTQLRGPMTNDRTHSKALCL